MIHCVFTWFIVCQERGGGKDADESSQLVHGPSGLLAPKLLPMGVLQNHDLTIMIIITTTC